MKDGKIQELWEEYDEVAMSSQMSGVWRIIGSGTRPSTLKAYSLPKCGPKVSPDEYLRPLASSCSEAIESPRIWALQKKPA